MMNWMIAAILICGASMVSSCFYVDNPVETIPVKCTNYSVSFKFDAPAENNAFFQTKYAWWSGDTQHGPIGVYGTFVSQTYPVTENITFPAKEAFYLHYKVKDVELTGNYTLSSKGEYTVTSYDANGNVLDTKKHEWDLNQGGAATAADLDLAKITAYVELLVSIAEDGTITLTNNSMKEDESLSGIVW